VLFARHEHGPIVFPDEGGYLVGARWLTGGPGGDFSGSTFYQAGYALLMAPAYLFSDDPQVVYPLALGINALVGAAVFPLGHLLLLRCGVRPPHTYAVAWAAALLPATTLFGMGALADSVLPVILLGWLLALDRFVGRPGMASGVLASLLAGLAFATHMRGTVVLAVHMLLVAAYLVRGRSRRAALAALGTGLAAWAASTAVNARLTAALYPNGPKDHGGILRDHLTSAGGQLWALSGAVGQLWAMVAGTWGLGGVGAVAVAGALLRSRTAREDRIMAGVLLTVTCGIAYASSAALPDEHRVGNFAYGRYLACVALVYALIGLAVIVQGRSVARRVAVTAVLLAGTGLWVHLYAGRRAGTHQFFGWDFPEVGLLGGSYAELRIAVTTTVACVLLLAFWGLRRWRITALFTALLLFNLCALTVMSLLLTQPVAKPIPSVPGPPTGGVALDRRVLAEHPEPALLTSRLTYAVWWTKLTWYDPRRGRPGPGICAVIVQWPAGGFAQDSWPEHPAGWRFSRANANGNWWVVWRDPGCPTLRR
jgi:hypothetical protein